MDVQQLAAERVVSLLCGAPNTVVTLTVETPSLASEPGTPYSLPPNSDALTPSASDVSHLHLHDAASSSMLGFGYDGQTASHRVLREGDLVTLCVPRRKARADMSEQMVGIGLGFARSLSGAFLVTQVLEGSPAAEVMRQGKMAVGDRLYAIDGRELQGLHMVEVTLT